jgi:hypothetical protein
MVMAMQVRKTEGMPPEDFERHIVLRHSDKGEIGTLTAVQGVYRADRPAWEQYHKRLHETGEYDHEH